MAPWVACAPESDRTRWATLATRRPKDLAQLANRGTKELETLFPYWTLQVLWILLYFERNKGELSQYQTSQATESASTPGLWLMWQLKAKRTEKLGQNQRVIFNPFSVRTWAYMTTCQSFRERKHTSGWPGFLTSKSGSLVRIQIKTPLCAPRPHPLNVQAIQKKELLWLPAPTGPSQNL